MFKTLRNEKSQYVANPSLKVSGDLSYRDQWEKMKNKNLVEKIISIFLLISGNLKIY